MRKERPTAVGETPDETPDETGQEARRYEPPRIVSREKLEVIAAVCSPGKASGQPGDCFLNTNS